MEKLSIADITLKQAAKNSDYALSFREKIEIAKLLDKVNVSVIELPQIIKEKSDVLLIKSIASCVASSVIAVPVNLEEKDVERIAEALKCAKKPRIQVVVPTSTVQMEYICKKKPPMVLEMIRELVAKAKTLCGDVEFVADDATRSEIDFLYSAVSAAVEAGATTVTLCDTAGTMLADEISTFIDDVYANVPSLENVKVGIQCSNEMSMSVALCVSAVKSGVREIKVTSISGTEAAALEPVCQAVKVHSDALMLSTDVKMTEFHRIAKQIEWIANAKRSKNSPFDSAMGTLGNDFVLNEHDDITEVAKAVKVLGYDLSQDDMTKVYDEFKRISRKKPVGAKELDAIIASAALQVPATYFLESYVINSGNVIPATANICVTKNGEKINGLAGGDGPIDAAFLAIEQIVGHRYELDDFQIQSVTEGQEAMGSALVKLRNNGKLYSGKGISTDIIGASIRAYLNAINKIVYEEA
ncbi:MAG: alpha-isopropylmalate synthase regulatory domain-containing protein [Acutalibacteraceae bacterium]|nr:alpha-isopropylmalate synthase regulatory domain-containing protein [Acutalibacteraceae bacterium]